MNILIITMEMQVGGAETHIFELARELKKRNHNVYVISAGGKYADALENEGISHIYAPLKDKKPLNMIKSYTTIKRIIKEKNIDVAHAHARIPSFISSKACKRLNVPLVTTIHGMYKVNILLKILTNWGQKSLAVSEDIKAQVIRDYGYNESDINVTVNGINTEEYVKNDNAKIPEGIEIDKDKFCIIHVSRLDNDSSNIAKMLINTFNDLKKETGDKIQLIIVGDGDDFSSVKEVAKSQKGIILTGLRTDVANILKCSNLFVGVSRAALEAMSCELPVILAGNKNYGQGFLGIFDEKIKEKAVETNFCCRDCEEVTYELLKEEILKVYAMSKDERNKLGEYGRNIVKEYYSIHKMTDDAENMYKSVILAKTC